MVFIVNYYSSLRQFEKIRKYFQSTMFQLGERSLCMNSTEDSECFGRFVIHIYYKQSILIITDAVNKKWSRRNYLIS